MSEISIAREAADLDATAPQREAGTAAPASGEGGLVMLLPSALTAVLMAWGLTAPSYWRDEAATLSATRRSFGGLLHMMQSVDLVHCVHYLMLWPLVHVFGDGEAVLRLPSAFAMTVAAYGVAWLGRRLVSLRVGVLAGVFFALTPTVSQYGQQGRSSALAIAFAVLALCLLLVAADKHGARSWWLYGAGLALSIATSATSLLLLPVHAWLVRTTAKPDERDVVTRRWGLTATCVVVLVLPLVISVWAQRSALVWLSPPGIDQGAEFLFELLGSVLLTLPVLFLIGTGLARDRSRATLVVFHGPVLMWLLLPGLVLLVVSWHSPMLMFRYVAYCLPALALLCGHGLARLGRRAMTVTLVIVVLAALPAQSALRQPDGHGGGDDLRRLSSVLATTKRPGDVIVYYPAFWRHLESAYPEGFQGLRDVALRESPVQAADLDGTEVPAGELRDRLNGVQRVWLLGGDVPHPAHIKADAGWPVKHEIRASPTFGTAGIWSSGGLELRLLVRRRPSGTNAQVN